MNIKSERLHEIPQAQGLTMVIFQEVFGTQDYMWARAGGAVALKAYGSMVYLRVSILWSIYYATQNSARAKRRYLGWGLVFNAFWRWT